MRRLLSDVLRRFAQLALGRLWFRAGVLGVFLGAAVSTAFDIAYGDSERGWMIAAAIAVWTALTYYTFVSIFIRKSHSRLKGRRLPLRGLVRLADFLPLPTRKKVRALAGDYDLEIRRLRRARRHSAATWNSALAWLIAIRIVLGAPVEWVLRVLLKLFRGA